MTIQRMATTAGSFIVGTKISAGENSNQPKMAMPSHLKTPPAPSRLALIVFKSAFASRNFAIELVEPSSTLSSTTSAVLATSVIVLYDS